LPETNFAENIYVGFVFKCRVAGGPESCFGCYGSVQSGHGGGDQEEEEEEAAPMQLITNPLITGVINKSTLVALVLICHQEPLTSNHKNGHITGKEKED
jgi:hypothetical protein